MAFTTVADYISEAQAMAQDTGPVRYPQARWLQALNAGLGEAYRMRPDLFRGLSAPPSYTIADLAGPINWSPMYAFPLILYMVGHINLTDLSGNEDQRAAAMLNTFTAKLTKTGT